DLHDYQDVLERVLKEARGNPVEKVIGLLEKMERKKIFLSDDKFVQDEYIVSLWNFLNLIPVERAQSFAKALDDEWKRIKYDRSYGSIYGLMPSFLSLD